MTHEEVLDAVCMMRAVVPFFPKDELAAAMIADVVAGFVGSTEQLRWLTTTCITKLEAWPSLVQLRALYCTQFPPADGIYPPVPCEIPGFRPEDFERQFFARQTAENDAKLLAWKRERLLAPPAEREPFALPEVKSVPALPAAKPRICRNCHRGSHPETFVADVCPKCGNYSRPMNLRELEESVGLMAKEASSDGLA